MVQLGIGSIACSLITGMCSNICLSQVQNYIATYLYKLVPSSITYEGALFERNTSVKTEV